MFPAQQHIYTVLSSVLMYKGNSKQAIEPEEAKCCSLVVINWCSKKMR